MPCYAGNLHPAECVDDAVYIIPRATSHPLLQGEQQGLLEHGQTPLDCAPVGDVWLLFHSHHGHRWVDAWGQRNLNLQVSKRVEAGSAQGDACGVTLFCFMT